MSKIKSDTNKRFSRRLTTILVVDISGYSKESETRPENAIRLADEAFDIFSKLVAEFDGRVFNRIADAFLAEFKNTNDGVTLGVKFLKLLKQRNHGRKQRDKIDVRLGLHVGDVTDRDDGDLFGHAVNVASRLQEKADTNGFLVSKNVFNLIQKSPELKLSKRGKVDLKNISPIEIYSVSSNQSPISRLVGRLYHRIKLYRYPLIFTLILLGFFTYFQKTLTTDKVLVESLIEKEFPDLLADQTNGYSKEYLSYVIRNLEGSNIRSERAAYELIKSGNVAGAIENLERYRRDKLSSIVDPIPFNGDTHLELLNLLAALSYHHDPTKAASYYQSILIIEPENSRAKLWLARAKNQKGESIEANKVIQNIDETNISNKSDLFQLKMDKAFNHLLKHDFKTGAKELEALRTNAISLDNERLYIEWQTNLAIALERLGELEKAESLVADVVNRLNIIGADTNMPRAYSVWGQIFEQRGLASDPTNKGDLRNAIEKYKLQSEFGRKLSKDSDVAEAYHYMGAAHIALGEYELAKQKYALSLQIAQALNIQRSIVRSNIGFSYLLVQSGNKKLACELYKSIEADIGDLSIPLRPRNQNLYNEIRNKCLPT